MEKAKIPVDVLCVGAAAYDLVFAVPHHPAPDEKGFATDFTRCGGGPAANAAVTAARLGLGAAFAGYLGHDPFGVLHWQELEAENVHTALIVRGEAPTPLSVAWVKPDGQRALFNYRGQTRYLAVDAIDFAMVQPRVILFDGHEPDISPPLAETARAQGIPTVLDAGSVHRGTQALAPKVDYLVASEVFAKNYTGSTDPVSAASKLAAIAPTVVITLGQNGLVWQRGQESGALPAFDIDVVDSTGAGDVFHGAFAAGLASGMAWAELLRFSSAAAALCCTKMGARLGIPTRTQVDEFLKNTRVR